MIDAVTNLYNKGKTDGVTVHTTTYSLSTKASATASTYDMGASHTYRYINASAVWNAGSNSAHHSTTYTMGTKASAAASTYDLGASNKYRYINATAAWNKASSTGYTNGKINGLNLTTYLFDEAPSNSNDTYTVPSNCLIFILWNNGSLSERLSNNCLYYKHGTTLTTVYNLYAQDANHTCTVTYVNSTSIKIKTGTNGNYLFIWKLN